MLEGFCGNRAVVETLEQMLRDQRLQQTILLTGPEGIGKATMARRFGAALLGGSEKIERDDLSLAVNIAMIADREKLSTEKRADDPLLLASHPDFVTFPPDGPLRQISIQQIRLLKEQARMKPSKGRWRVFLIDHIDRANEQAANSLLKVLEEPPDHLILILTAENAYDLLPTIRSRAIQLQMSPLAPEEMREFVRERQLTDAARRVALAVGSPGFAISLDLEAYDRRRQAMLILLQAATGIQSLSRWVRVSESLGSSKQEKLEYYLKVLYSLLEDVLLMQVGVTENVQNPDIRKELAEIAGKISFTWIRIAVFRVDELMELLRRNIQKNLALDALVIGLQNVEGMCYS